MCPDYCNQFISGDSKPTYFSRQINMAPVEPASRQASSLGAPPPAWVKMATIHCHRVEGFGIYAFVSSPKNACCGRGGSCLKAGAWLWSDLLVTVFPVYEALKPRVAKSHLYQDAKMLMHHALIKCKRYSSLIKTQ